MEYDSKNDANYIKDLGEVAFNEKGIAQTSFKPQDIKTKLNELYLEGSNYELFFVIEKKKDRVVFAEVEEKSRGGITSYYPKKIAVTSQKEIGKFLYINGEKEVVDVRYLDEKGNRIWKILEYGEDVTMHIQTKNLSGTKLVLDLYLNLPTKTDVLIDGNNEFTVPESEVLQIPIKTEKLKGKVSDPAKIAMFYCVLKESDGDTFQYPEDLKINQTLDVEKVNFYHHLKLSEPK